MVNNTRECAIMHLYMSGGRTSMDRISESLLNEFSEEQDIGSLPEDKRFEHFASYIVVKRHYPGTFDTDDIIVGEGGDTGIDGIAIIVNGTMVTDIEDEIDSEALDVSFIFVQAKTSPSFESSDIANLGFGVLDFFQDVPRLRRNQKVNDMAAIMASIYRKSSKFTHNPHLRLYYVTTGKWLNDDNLEGRQVGVRKDLEATNMFGSVEFRPIDAQTLQKLYRQARNATTAEFNFHHSIALPKIDKVKQSYLGFMPAKDFVNLVKREDDEFLGGVFYDNPRDWQEYNTVNREIKNTLASENPSRFVLMNNGITIIARSVQQTGDTFNIRDYQIVNGCQTSHVLYDQRSNLTGDIMVPIRLIGTDDETIINDIIRATNRQTEIKEDQFFATQEFPKQLEAYFQSFPTNRKLYYERRNRQYDSLPVEKTRVITHPNMIRAFAAAILNEPHRTTRNYKELTKKVGKDIFGKDHRYAPYYLAAVALYRLEYMFRGRKLEAKYKPARFHILMALRILASNDNMPPQTNSHEMERYCNRIIEVFWDNSQAEKLLEQAVSVITKVANGNYERDNIRSEPFTKQVLAECVNLQNLQKQELSK
ncbi:MAG: AIPR family protein [Dehalococcoidia bacterium]|nr:AIPR family protein [Dehalococcoidia bacterium]